MTETPIKLEKSIESVKRLRGRPTQFTPEEVVIRRRAVLLALRQKNIAIHKYACAICKQSYGSLTALTTHLRSPTHAKRIAFDSRLASDPIN